MYFICTLTARQLYDNQSNFKPGEVKTFVGILDYQEEEDSEE